MGTALRLGSVGVDSEALAPPASAATVASSLALGVGTYVDLTRHDADWHVNRLRWLLELWGEEGKKTRDGGIEYRARSTPVRQGESGAEQGLL